MLHLYFTEFPVLQTERLILREIKKEDAPQLLILRSDPEVLRYVDKEPMRTLAEAEELIERIRDSFVKTDGISWAINLKGSNELIALAGLWRIIKEHHRAEIGYTLLPEYWNLGLMSEALKAIIDFGFNSMKLHSIEANINPDNKASIRTAEKMGFVREAYFRENYYFQGQFLDSAIYSLLNRQ